MIDSLQSKFRHSRTIVLAVTVLVLAGLILRIIRLDFQPLWWDEGYSVWFAGQSLGDMVRLTAEDIHPPLYYGLLHIWSLALGLSPVAIRLFSVLVSLAAIPLAYILGRDLEDQWTGLIAAGFVSVNGLAIFYSQEIRMYGLATTFSLAALWTGWRWVQPRAERKFGIGYALSLVAGLYTLYYFALLPLAQTVWVLLAARTRLRAWLAAVSAAVLLFVPWLLYAGPKLLNYVAYKVVQDNDTPLSLFPYFGRHLSAFLVGHLEGRLAPLWPWALLLLIPLIAVFIFVRPQANSARGRTAQKGRETGNKGWRERLSNAIDPALGYLLLCLLVPLTVGFIQQWRAPFIPDRFERVLLFAAPALWLLVAIGIRRLARETVAAAALVAALLLIANIASLASFYTTPRYQDQDYRPLIAAVAREAADGDSVFTIFPWQTGYFWAYLPAERHDDIIPTPEPAWGLAVQSTLDELLTRGAIWFPEHLALGGLLERAAEDYLGRNAYQIMNRWYGDETRLTAWAPPPDPTAAIQALTTPIAWQNGVTLTSAQLVSSAATDGVQRAFLDLGWMGERAIRPDNVTFSIWLTDAQGNRWAQRDVNPFAHPAPPLDPEQTPWTNQDRIVLSIPMGTPPGEYDMWAALLDAGLNQIPLAGSNPAPQAWLGSYTILLPAPASPEQIDIAFPDHVRGESIDFLGSSRSDKPMLPGDDLAVSLYWLPNAALEPDHNAFLQLLDDQEQVVAAVEGPPIPWHPTSAWTPGVPLRSQHTLRIPADLAPGEYTLIAGLFDPASGQRHQWGREDYLDLGPVSVEARQHNYQPPKPQHPLNLTLEGGHKLVGYDLLAGSSPGSPINLTLYWQPAGAMDQRYSTFVHLLGSADTILDQSDNEPDDGYHPTTSWVAGEFIADAHTLTIPPDAASDRYRLAVGLYHPPTGRRLPFVDEQGEVVADHIVLPLE